MISECGHYITENFTKEEYDLLPIGESITYIKEDHTHLFLYLTKHPNK